MNEQNQNSTSLRQTYNNAKIIGYVKEIRLEDRVSDRGNAIGGSITVHIPPYSDHVITVYENQLSGNGNPNRNYTALQTIRKEYVSMAFLMSPPNNRTRAQAMEECSKIEATAELTLNEYRSQTGEFESRPSLRGRFFSRVDGEFTPKASFTAECYINKIADEFKDGEDTGRKIVDVYTTNYRGEVLPQRMIVPSDLADAFGDIYEAGQTAQFYGEAVNSVITIAAPQGGFGRQEARTSRVRELVIMGGDPPYAEENRLALSPAAIKAAVEVRLNETIPSIMARERNAASPAAPVTAGFGTPAANNSALAQAAADFRF